MPGTSTLGSLLIVGGSGELGRATVVAACASGGWEGKVCATYRSGLPQDLEGTKKVEWVHLDCSDHKEMRAVLASSRRIASVIYCAVPKHRGANAGDDVVVRNGIVEDVAAAAEAAAMCGARFVAVSTDLVYDGKLPAGELYPIDAPTCPIGAYGRYKVEMEKRLADISGSIVIARSSLILTLGDEKRNMKPGKAIQFVLDAIEGKHGKIELFEDELRCMSFADDLGAALVEIASPDSNVTGIVNLVSDEVANRWMLAKLLAKKYSLTDKIDCGQYAVSGLSKDSGLNRPLNCALDSTQTKDKLKTKIRGISERLG